MSNLQIEICLGPEKRPYGFLDIKPSSWTKLVDKDGNRDGNGNGDGSGDRNSPSLSSSSSPSSAKVFAADPNLDRTETFVPSTTLPTDQLEREIVTSPELAVLLRDKGMQARLMAILDAPDPVATLQQALQDDPDGIGKVANVIYRIMDKK